MWGNLNLTPVVGESSEDTELTFDVPSGNFKFALKPRYLERSPYILQTYNLTDTHGLKEPFVISLQRAPGLLIKLDRTESPTNPFRKAENLLYVFLNRMLKRSLSLRTTRALFLSHVGWTSWRRNLSV